MITVALFHQAHEFREMYAQIFLKLLDGDAIDSGCAFVALDAPEGFGHEFESDSPGERVMFAFACRSHRTRGWEAGHSHRGDGQAASLEITRYLREGEGC
jgi:hypothetical protein